MLQGNTGHRVFSTIYGKVAVNICYGRHHPQVDDENYYDDNDGDGNGNDDNDDNNVNADIDDSDGNEFVCFCI